VSAPETPLRTFRDAIREISPVWLRGRIGGGILCAIAAELDALSDACVAGVKLRFPRVYGTESLPLIGRERRILRGRLDTDTTYSVRLSHWLDDHRRRGGPYALLGQLHAHFAPANFPIQLVYRSGRRFTMDVAGAITMDVDSAFAPDANPARWARWWLYYTWPNPVGKRKWGDGGKWGEGGVWGSDLTPVEVRDLRAVPREWNAAHAIGWIVLLTSDKDVQLSVQG